jgi:WD40 repeat protein
MAVSKNNAAILAGGNEIQIFENGEKTKTIKTAFEATAVGLSKDSKTVAVGDESGKVHLYDANSLAEKSCLEENRGAISCISYSPDGNLVAVGDSKSRILVYSTSDNSVNPNLFR